MMERLEPDEAWVWAFDLQRRYRWTAAIAGARTHAPWLWRVNVWLPLLELGDRAGSLLMEAERG